MITYIVYILVLTVCAYLCLFSQHPKIFVGAMLIIIFIFTAFRDSIGVDTMSYQDLFEQIHSGNSLDYIEKGYVGINSIVGFIGGGYVLVQIICFGLSLFLIYKFLNNSIPLHYIGFGLIALICSITYLSYLCSGVRQGIAMSFCLFYSKYIVNRDFMKFIIGLIIAMMFHTSAIIFLPAYFIIRRKLNIWLVITMFVVAYFSAPIVKLLFDNIIGMVTGHYMGYASMFNGDANSNSGLGIIARIAIWTIIIVLCHYQLSDTTHNNIFLNLFIVGVCLYLMNRNVDILNRLNEYYLSFFMIVFPLSIKAFNFRSKKVYVLGSCLLLIGLFLSFILFVKDAFIPYKSYITI